MLETYFSASKLLGHLRSGPSGPHLDGFAAALVRQGYSACTAVRYLRAAAHLGHVVARQGALPSDIDLAAVQRALAHLSMSARHGRAPQPPHHFRRQALSPAPCRNRRLPVRCCRTAACRAAPGGSLQSLAAQAPRGVRSHHQALRPRRRPLDGGARGRSRRLGTGRIRSFVLDRASHCGNGTIEKLTTSLRAFLRYLAVEGRCQAGLADAVPGYAHWRLADLPRYLAAEQVNRLIAACDGEVVARRRDRAIVLLLVRLGLRAGDVAQLRLDDIEWETGSLRVSGKSRYEVRLPLPQDVGDAIAAYLGAALRPARAITCSSAISRRFDRSGTVTASRRW